MKKIKNITAALFAGTLLLCGCSRQEEQPMTLALKEAMAGNWSKADNPSAAALKKTPDNVNALVLRAVICERLNRTDEAVENARKAVNIDSNSFAALYTLGRLYTTNRHRKSESVNLLIKANRINPGHPGPLILLANLHIQGQKGSYLAALLELPEYAKNPEVLFESHMNRVYNGDRRGVDEAYKRLMAENPDNPQLFSAIGGYFHFYKNYKMARKAYQSYMSFPADRRNSASSAKIQKRLRAMPVR